MPAFYATTTNREGQFSGYSLGDQIAVLYDPADHGSVVVDEQAAQAAADAEAVAAHIERSSWMTR